MSELYGLETPFLKICRYIADIQAISPSNPVFAPPKLPKTPNCFATVDKCPQVVYNLVHINRVFPAVTRKEVFVMKMKNMKRVLAAVLCFVMVAAMFAGCKSSENKKNYAAKNTEFVIGVSGPLTGGAAVYGTAVKNSAQMAVDEINAAGGLNGIKFKLIATDDMHDPSKVSTNYSSMLEAGMQVSLGTVTTKPGMEFSNLSKEDNVFFLTPSATGDSIPANANGYQMCFADSNQGGEAAKFVNENYANQTVGVFYKADDPYSTGILAKFKEKLNSSVTLVETSFTEANATDFSSQIDSLKNCKLVFLPIYYQPASLLMEQGKDIIAPDAVYYGCDGLDGIDGYYADIATISQEVSMLSHFNSGATEGAAKEYIDKYVAKFGKDTLNQFGASAYDCIYAIYGAMKAASAKDANAIKVTMSASDLCEVLKKEFQGGYSLDQNVTGSGKPIVWDKDGYVAKEAIKYTIKEAG